MVIIINHSNNKNNGGDNEDDDDDYQKNIFIPEEYKKYTIKFLLLKRQTLFINLKEYLS